MRVSTTLFVGILLATILAVGLATGCKKSGPVEGLYDTTHASALGEKARGYPFLASILREPFHKASCKWAESVHTHNLVGYDSRENAIADGHRPCKVCRP